MDSAEAGAVAMALSATRVPKAAADKLDRIDI
jgi:hypothetical protein